MKPSEPQRLSLRERALYHQTHPLKLATDISTAVMSGVLLTRHELAIALLVMWVPSIVISSALIVTGDFSGTRDAPVGAYLRQYMTREMEGVRFAGAGVAFVGAWFHQWWLVVAGAAVIAWAWGGGWLRDRRGPRT